MTRRSRPATVLCMLVALAVGGSVLAADAPPEPKVRKKAATNRLYNGQQGVFVPERTEAGNWDGTWYYNSIESKIALWLRTRRGKVEAKVKYQSLQHPLAFETDWKGTSSYYNAEQPSSFTINFSKMTPNDLDGTWKWDTRVASASRNETGTFSMFRGLDGRTLVMEFKEYEVVLIGRGETIRVTTPPTWTFIKASKREALWDELPF